MFPSRRVTMGGDVFRNEYSLEFDGTNDYIDLGASLSLGTGDFTISIWAKHTTWGDSHQYLISQYADTNNRWYFRVQSGSPPRFQLYTKIGGSESGQNGFYGVPTNEPLLSNLNNQWVNFCLSSDRDGQNRGYINAVFNDDDSGSTATMDNGGNIEIAKHSTARFGGGISEVVLYDKALSSSEVATIYNGREPYNHKEGACSSNLTGWWRMGDGLERASGSTIYDMSDSSNNGTMNNIASDAFKGDTP